MKRSWGLRAVARKPAAFAAYVLMSHVGLRGAWARDSSVAGNIISTKLYTFVKISTVTKTAGLTSTAVGYVRK